MIHCMLDLETLGSRVGSVVLSVGAVCFDPAARAVTATFDMNMSETFQRNAGLEINPDTVAWWEKQSPLAFDAARRNPSEPMTVLRAFNQWYINSGAEKIWGNGAGFDQPLLRAVYEAFGIKPAWHYRDELCFRTLKALCPNVPPPIENALKHSALADARFQAAWAIDMMETLR